MIGIILDLKFLFTSAQFHSGPRRARPAVAASPDPSASPIIDHNQAICDPPLVVMHLVLERAQGRVGGERASEVVEECEGGHEQGHHGRFSR
jgi:hypothetical protein